MTTWTWNIWPARWLIGCAWLLACMGATVAAIPGQFTHQGFLTDAGGTPVNASVEMTFSLYAAASGGSALWSETHQVAVQDGLYAATLGATHPFDLSVLPFDAQYHLGIRVGSDAEMTPRHVLTSVPYALRAGCDPGDLLECYTGPAGTLGIGNCVSGKRSCAADGLGFGSCEGQVLPAAEIPDQQDNDCNGVVDDNGYCDIGSCSLQCWSQHATCDCQSSEGPCVVLSCDADYGDCNDSGSDGCETNLTANALHCGACNNACGANEVCSSGSCVEAVEICGDGIDNDGDGQIDEDEVCDTDGDGFQVGEDCDDTNAAVHPGALEVCDGIDNDCNGQTDEGLSCP